MKKQSNSGVSSKREKTSFKSVAKIGRSMKRQFPQYEDSQMVNDDFEEI